MAFQKPDNGPYSPGLDGFAITPDDDNDLAQLARAIHIGGAGDLKIDTYKGTTLTFKGLTAGSRFDSTYVARVHATDTTATDLVGISV
jgi:hypothetical protein